MSMKASVGLVPMLLLAACATGGSAGSGQVSVGPGQVSDEPCVWCELVVDNQTATSVTLSYYAEGGRRLLGDISALNTGTFEVLKPLTRSGVTLVAEVDGRDSCRGVVALPGRFVVGNPLSCRPERAPFPGP